MPVSQSSVTASFFSFLPLLLLPSEGLTHLILSTSSLEVSLASSSSEMFLVALFSWKLPKYAKFYNFFDFSVTAGGTFSSSPIKSNGVPAIIPIFAETFSFNARNGDLGTLEISLCESSCFRSLLFPIPLYPNSDGLAPSDGS